MKNKTSVFKVAITLPVIIYAIFLILIPIGYILLISFFRSDSYGGMISELTLQNYAMIFEDVYVKVCLKSFLIALITTVLCIVIAYPFTIYVNQKSETVKKVLSTLVILK